MQMVVMIETKSKTVPCISAPILEYDIENGHTIVFMTWKDKS